MRYSITLLPGSHRFFDFLLPRVCAGCKNALQVEENTVCHTCQKSMHFLPAETASQILLKLRQESGTIHSFTAPYLFDKGEVVQALIHNFKYRLQYPIGKFIGSEIAHHLQTRPLPFLPDCIIPVPLHPKRRGERGFNQTVIMGKTLAGFTGIPCLSNGLKRTRYTPKQAWMKKTERKNNIRDAFSVPTGKNYQGKKVLLLDDVVTTGATVCECSRVLRKAGATEIAVVSFAAVL